ncbi:hypothetical protein FTX61_14785 [Nitriliruptoraceae bacterium ZYF776]|nr:hypothetical protein [Profundirhabdus halotolerans]
MGRALGRGVVAGTAAVVAVGVVAVLRPSLGLASAWPAIVGASLVLLGGRGDAAGVASVARTAAAVLGAVVAWVAYAVRLLVFGPDVASAQALVLVVGLLVVLLVTGWLGHGAAWAGALGFATFHGVFEPVMDADPPGFLATSPSVLLATSAALVLGAVGAAAGAAVAGSVSPRRRSEVEAEVAA